MTTPGAANSKDAPLQSVGRRLTKDSLLLFSNAILLKGFTILASILLARILGPGALGLWAVVTATGGLAWVIADLGLSVAAMAKVAETKSDPEDRARVQTTAMYLALGLGGLVVAGYTFIIPLFAEDLYQAPGALPLFFLSSATMFLSLGPNILAAILHGQRRFKRLAALAGGLGVLNATALVVGAWAYGLVGAFVASLVCTGVGFVVYLSSFRGEHRVRWDRTHFRWDLAKRLLGIAFPGVTSTLVTQLGSWLTLTFLVLATSRAGGGLDLVGQYFMAWRIAQFVVFPTSAIWGAMFPMAAETAKADPVLFTRTYRQTLRYSLIVTIPASLLLGLLAPEIIALLYGPAYAPTAPLLSLLAPAGLLLSVTAFGAMLFIVRERMPQGATVVASAAILQCVAGAFLVPLYLAHGLVVATLVHYVALVTLTPLMLRGVPTHSELRRGFLLALLAAGVLLTIGAVATQVDLLWRFVLLAGLLGGYLWFVLGRVFTTGDWQFVRSLFSGAKRRLGIR